MSVHFALKAKVFRLRAQGEIESEGKNGDYQLRIVSPLKSERLPHLNPLPARERRIDVLDLAIRQDWYLRRIDS